MYIYIHIPFCRDICSYCDFPKVFYDKKYVNNYLDSLEKEIKYRYKEEEVKSLYIGGGTPSSLDYDELERLFQILKVFKKDKDIEFTIEANVELLDEKKIDILKKYGINRVSLGVQSFNKRVLKSLGRFHDKNKVFEIVEILKNKGIFNISIDLMYGIFDDVDIVKRDIENFLRLDIPHISCYSLIIEDNTVYGVNGKEYIDEDIEYEMYRYIERRLIEKGYEHYEISNYAKEGYYSYHNLNYWDNGEYYGFGLGAVSYLDNMRINNTRNLTKYLKGNFINNSCFEDREVRISNSIILGLRKIKGIKIRDFEDKYSVRIMSLYNIEQLVKEGILINDGEYLYINSKYCYLSNEILINFV